MNIDVILLDKYKNNLILVKNIICLQEHQKSYIFTRIDNENKKIVDKADKQRFDIVYSHQH